jgi:hypothetical protein
MEKRGHISSNIFKVTAVACLTLCFALSVYAQNADIAQLLQTKKGFEENHYPPSKSGSFNFTIIDPGIALVPVGGGVYMAGWKQWYIPPVKSNMPFATDYSVRDSGLYFFTVNKTKCMVIKASNSKTVPGFKKILEMPYGNYSLKVVNPNFIWIWGQQNGVHCVWKYDMKELKLFYISPAAIVDLAAINQNDIVIATKTTVITMGLKRPGKEIIKMDVAIDGLAMHNDGTLFVSTDRGILHYLSPEVVDDANVITYGIHGKLRRYGNNLYVLWKEDNQVLKIKL